MLEEIIERDVNTIPYFLNIEFKNHLFAYKNLQSILWVINQVDVENFLSDSDAKEIEKFIEKKLDLIKNSLTYLEYIKLIDWLNFKIFYYRDFLLKFEKFEQVKNLEAVFFRILKNKKSIEEN